MEQHYINDIYINMKKINVKIEKLYISAELPG